MFYTLVLSQLHTRPALKAKMIHRPSDWCSSGNFHPMTRGIFGRWHRPLIGFRSAAQQIDSRPCYCHKEACASSTQRRIKLGMTRSTRRTVSDTRSPSLASTCPCCKPHTSKLHTVASSTSTSACAGDVDASHASTVAHTGVHRIAATRIAGTGRMRDQQGSKQPVFISLSPDSTVGCSRFANRAWWG